MAPYVTILKSENHTLYRSKVAAKYFSHILIILTCHKTSKHDEKKYFFICIFDILFLKIRPQKAKLVIFVMAKNTNS